MDANIQPVPMGRKLSASGMLLIIVLGLAGLYAVARTVDIVDRLSFISKIESGRAAQEIQNGTTTEQQFEAKAKSVDHRDSIFVTISWIVTIGAFLAYRNWSAQGPRQPLPPEKQWMGASAGVLWIIVIVTQFTRYVLRGSSLSALKRSSYINLVSRGLIIPAVILSVLVILERERRSAAT